MHTYIRPSPLRRTCRILALPRQTRWTIGLIAMSMSVAMPAAHGQSSSDPSPPEAQAPGANPTPFPAPVRVDDRATPAPDAPVENHSPALNAPAEPPLPLLTPPTTDLSEPNDPNQTTGKSNARGSYEMSPLTPAELRRLHADRGWPAGNLQKQLDKDSTLIPYGKGALFVPAMTDGRDEPPVTVWRGNEKIADATSGTRIPVAPGEYFVEVGSGTVEQRFGRTVQVSELKTTVLPVTWSGLTVHVVDPQLNSLRLPYEVIRMSDREYIGVGFGVDEQAGESEPTWILEPGLYKIVRVGGTYRDRQDFATVRLVDGMHTQYLLVLDPETSDFKGAGEARPEELFRPDQGFRASLILGGDLSLNARQSVVGYVDGNGYVLNAFLDTKLTTLIFDSPLLLRLQITEGQTRLPLQDWQKVNDIVQLDLLYIYKYKPWAGPYIRFEGVTNLFSTIVNLRPPAPVTIVDASTGASSTNSAASSIKLTPALGITSMREGAGMNLRLLKTIFGELNFRTGLGLQQTLNHDVLQQTGPHEYVRLASGSAFGIEGTLIAIGRITRWVVINILVDTLVPFNTHQRVNLHLEGTLAVKLTQYAAASYVLKYQSGPLFPRPVVEQDLLLRFSLELL